MAGVVRGWLVEDEGSVVAFAMGDRSNGEVQVVAVHPGYEGRGYGKAVLAAVVDWLVAEGHAEVWLYAARDPAVRATGFYRRLGWTPTGEVKGSDEVLSLTPRA
jgi:ribosomal protein S18 acetylase RimI-like enzyme